MRNLGGILVLLAVFGFVYASGRIDEHEPVPEGRSFGEALEYPAGRWEMTRYAFAGLAGFGLLMALFPKGR